MFTNPITQYGPRLLAVALILLLLVAIWLSGSTGAGRDLSYSLALGLAFGLVLQRSRFCFFCITRDFIDRRDSRGLQGLIVALAVGTLGYITVFGAILPIPSSGRLPPDAHVGPVTWVLALAAWVFGIGMAISRSCISAHFYRLGEGSVASAFALFGAALGFIIGFFTWNTLYLRELQHAATPWLPNYLGYGGTLMMQLGVLGLLSIALAYWHKAPASSAPPSEDGQFFNAIFVHRWPTHIGGLLVGFIATLAYFRITPLGVTAELGSLARTLGGYWQFFPDRLEGLDRFSGCATQVKEVVLSNNGAFVTALVISAWSSALFANQFKINWPSYTTIAQNFVGGVLMGWGAMTALGCTVGTLLSGIMAGALSGWVFAVFCAFGAIMTWTIIKRISSTI